VARAFSLPPIHTLAPTTALGGEAAPRGWCGAAAGTATSWLYTSRIADHRAILVLFFLFLFYSSFIFFLFFFLSYLFILLCFYFLSLLFPFFSF
jgi:hypothetical protein